MNVKEKMVFLLLVYFPSVCSGWCWAEPKPGTRSPFEVFLMGAGAQALELSFAAFPGMLAWS